MLYGNEISHYNPKQCCTTDLSNIVGLPAV